MGVSAAIEKSVSYVMAIPRLTSDIEDPQMLIDRLLEAEDFEVVSFSYDEEKDNPMVDILYQGESFHLDFFLEDFVLPELFTINHLLTEEDYTLLQESEVGITTAMIFGENAQQSYHLQIKVLAAMIPNMAGIMDFSSERIISGVWADMAALSQVPPAPTYLYSMQAVSNNDGQVWLHTHGLNRCGLIELEIVDTNETQYQNHSTILGTIASRAVSEGKLEDEKEPILALNFPNGIIVAAWENFADAIMKYPNAVGGCHDRSEDHFRNNESGLLFYYPTQEDYEQGNLVPLTAIDDGLYDNMLYMVTNEETERMQNLARERIGFLLDAISLEGAEVLVKMRLAVDEDKREEAGYQYEHIWFEAKEINEKFIWGILTQEAYWIADIHTGDKMKLSINDLTDWVIYLEDYRITPDDAYLLVQR